jgi:hypothetical protein
MDKKAIKLHKNMSQAEVKYQEKVDASKHFEARILGEGLVVSDAALAEYDRLKREEQAARQRMDAARNEYRRYIQSHQHRSASS